MTAPQLARHVRATAIALNPDLAEQRRVAERERRSVFLDPAPDAMARLIAYLPAAEATAAFTAIDALAGTSAVDGDTRTIDQRRADAFADVFLGILDRQTTPDGTPLPRKHGQRVALQVNVAASTLLGLDDAPGHLGSYGPIPAQLARELAQDGTWRRVLTDPHRTGLLGRHRHLPARRGPDPHHPSPRRDLHLPRLPATRHPVRDRPPHPLRPPPTTHRARQGRSRRPRRRRARRRSGDGGGHDRQTCEANLHALCKHHHQAKTDGWWNVTYNRTTGVSLWTDRHGLTYARHPVPIQVDPSAYEHRPATPPRPDLGDPPF